jgi:AraC-like DNA-binding protein
MKLTSYDIKCIQKAKAFIDADLSRHHSIFEIASHACTSPTKLKRGFKELTGTGVYHYLKEMRLGKAMYLVENSDSTLKEISRGAGYRHVSNFISAFKKRYGKSPAALRSTSKTFLKKVSRDIRHF